MSSRAETVDPGDVYESTRQRFEATMRSLDEGQLHTFVPATPAWRVRDLLAHVVGLVADLNAQRFPAADDIGGTAWGAAQVAARRNLTIDDIFDEWAAEAPGFEDGLRLFGYEEGSHFIADVHAHHQDVRGALGLARDDDPLTVAVSLDHYLGFLHQLLRDASWGVLAVATGGEVRVLGTEDGAGRAQVAGPAFEVLRAFSARRSASQIRAMRWRGDVDSLLELLESLFSDAYSIPAANIIE